MLEGKVGVGVALDEKATHVHFRLGEAKVHEIKSRYSIYIK